MSNDYQGPERESDLADSLNELQRYEVASTGQRLVNYIVDNLVMNFGLSMLTGHFLVVVLDILVPEYLRQVMYSENPWDQLLVTYLLAIINYNIYYTLCEKGFRGKTLGKLITGTRAIRVDGQELTLKNATLRSLVRLVPFEAFSALGIRPWHDSWTGTTVVKSR